MFFFIITSTIHFYFSLQFPRYSTNSSTSTLRNHVMSHHKEVSLEQKGVQKRTSMVLGGSSQHLSSSNQKSIWARRTALWICEDLLPFSVVSGSGFKKWLIRNKYVSNESEIASNVTISQSALNDCFSIVMDAFKEKISCAPNTITLVSDLWTSLGKQSYLTTSLRYIDNNFKLINVVLSTEPIEHPHTGERIAEAIQGNLASVGVNDRFLVVVGDNGRNIVRIGPHYNQDRFIPPLLPYCKQYVRCLGHRIHLVLNSDVVKESHFQNVVKLVGMMKRIHGAVAYKMNELRNEYSHLQLKELLQTMSEIDEITSELLIDEENGEYGDDEFIESVKGVYEQTVGGLETHTRFEQLNITRWKSAEKLTSSFVKNFGKFYNIESS